MSPGPLQRHQCHLGQQTGQVHRKMPSGQMVFLEIPLLCKAVLTPLFPGLAHQQRKGVPWEGLWGGSQEAHGHRDVTFPMLCHQPGGSLSAQSSPLGSCTLEKPPAPPSDTMGWVFALPWGHQAQQSWVGLLFCQGEARCPGSPIPVGRRLAAGQRCPSARGPQSGTRLCQQAACCLLDSEIWPQLARIQFNYDKQRLHPLSRD